MASGTSKSGAKKKSANKPWQRGTPKSAEEAVLAVNKDNFWKEGGYRINCQRCVWAYEMQRRGYDVEALPNNDGLGRFERWHSIVDGKVEKKYLGNPFGRNTQKNNEKQATSIMDSWGDGSRAAVVFSRKSGSGHVFNVEYKNGKITVYDSQSGKTNTSLAKYLTSEKASTSFVYMIRTDNLKFKESEYPKYFKERGK